MAAKILYGSKILYGGMILYGGRRKPNVFAL
jgi:hypothetical protein